MFMTKLLNYVDLMAELNILERDIIKSQKVFEDSKDELPKERYIGYAQSLGKVADKMYKLEKLEYKKQDRYKFFAYRFFHRRLAERAGGIGMYAEDLAETLALSASDEFTSLVNKELRDAGIEINEKN